MFAWDEISPNGAGVIATIIPVFLLAGLLDVEGLLHVLAPPQPRGQAAWARRVSIGWRVLTVLGIGAAAYSVGRGLLLACQGVALGITLRSGDASAVWISLLITAMYLAVMVLARLVRRYLDSKTADDRWNALQMWMVLQIDADKQHRQQDARNREREQQQEIRAVEARAGQFKAMGDVSEQLKELNRQLLALRSDLGSAVQRPLPAPPPGLWAWIRRNTRGGKV